MTLPGITATCGAGSAVAIFKTRNANTPGQASASLVIFFFVRRDSGENMRPSSFLPNLSFTSHAIRQIDFGAPLLRQIRSNLTGSHYFSWTNKSVYTSDTTKQNVTLGSSRRNGF
jgi:hypothetical protein